MYTKSQIIEINEFSKTIKWLTELAPNIALNKANTFAIEMAKNAVEFKRFRDALLAIGIHMFKMDESGNIPNDITELINNNYELRYAYNIIIMLHAEWACSPFNGGLEAFHKDLSAEIQEEKSKNKWAPLPLI